MALVSLPESYHELAVSLAEVSAVLVAPEGDWYVCVQGFVRACLREHICHRRTCAHPVIHACIRAHLNEDTANAFAQANSHAQTTTCCVKTHNSHAFIPVGCTLWWQECRTIWRMSLREGTFGSRGRLTS